MAANPPLPGKLGEYQKTMELEVAEIKKIETGKHDHKKKLLIEIKDIALHYKHYWIAI